MKMKRTITLLQQAACFIDLEAEDLETRPTSDHRGRSVDQLKKIAATNRQFAKVLREHASALELSSQ
jgi:hypothetical protein